VKRHIVTIQMKVAEYSKAKVGHQAFLSFERLSPGQDEASGSKTRLGSFKGVTEKGMTTDWDGDDGKQQEQQKGQHWWLHHSVLCVGCRVSFGCLRE